MVRKSSRRRRSAQPTSVNGNVFAVPASFKPTPIEWPTQQELLQVSKRLARISREGMRCEAKGDYFNSGDLAYRVQEIIKATAELFKKCQRANS